MKKKKVLKCHMCKYSYEQLEDELVAVLFHLREYLDKKHLRKCIETILKEL